MKKLIMSLSLLLGGNLYASWQSVRVEQNIDHLAHAFSFSAFVNAKQGVPEAGTLCQVRIGALPCLTGYIEKTSTKANSDGVAISVAGRSKTADIVDCSANTALPPNAKLEEIAGMLCLPYGIGIITNTNTGAGFLTPRIQNDGIFPYLSKLAKQRSCILMTDAMGNLVITRTGAINTGATLTKENIKSIEVEKDISNRYSKYVIIGKSLMQKSVVGGAIDHEIKRTRIKQESIYSYDPTACIQKANWLKNRMLGESERIKVAVQGLEMTPGQSWQINTIINVSISEMNITGQYLIAKIELEASKQGSQTTLYLKKQEAYI